MLDFLQPCRQHLMMLTFLTETCFHQQIVSIPSFIIDALSSYFCTSISCMYFLQVKCVVPDSLQLDRDACGNLRSTVGPCYEHMTELKGGHYNKIVEISQDAGKCLLDEYEVVYQASLQCASLFRSLCKVTFFLSQIMNFFCLIIGGQTLLLDTEEETV